MFLIGYGYSPARQPSRPKWLTWLSAGGLASSGPSAHHGDTQGWDTNSPFYHHFFGVEPSKTRILPCFTLFYQKKNNDLPIINGDLIINTGGLTIKHGDVMGYNFWIQTISVPKQLNPILLTFVWDVLRRHSSKIVLEILYSSIQSTCHMHAPCVMIASVWERERMSVLVLPFITSSRFKHVSVSKSFTKGLNVWCASHD